jgi:hypothetical protein
MVMQTSQGVLAFAIYPAIAVLAGGVVALWRTMKPGLISAVQDGHVFCWIHFAVND